MVVICQFMPDVFFKKRRCLVFTLQNETQVKTNIGMIVKYHIFFKQEI